MAKAIWERQGLFPCTTLDHMPPMGEVKANTQSRNLEVGPGTVCGGMLPIGLLAMAFSACLLQFSMPRNFLGPFSQMTLACVALMKNYPSYLSFSKCLLHVLQSPRNQTGTEDRGHIHRAHLCMVKSVDILNV